MELCYGTDKNIRRQYSLSRQEEVEIANRGSEFVGDEMYPVIVEISQLGAINYKMHPDYHKANSLIWIWVQMNTEMVRSNIYILMARKRIFSLNELARRLKMNASFIGRIVEPKDAIGFGGWNIDTIFRLSQVLDARPELMLMADLSEAVSAKVINWQV